ncbi:MAG: hypothetical protein WD845_15795 [Pirellulales bacterium]
MQTTQPYDTSLRIDNSSVTPSTRAEQSNDGASAADYESVVLAAGSSGAFLSTGLQPANVPQQITANINQATLVFKLMSVPSIYSFASNAIHFDRSKSQILKRPLAARKCRQRRRAAVARSTGDCELEGFSPEFVIQHHSTPHALPTDAFGIPPFVRTVPSSRSSLRPLLACRRPRP